MFPPNTKYLTGLRNGANLHADSLNIRGCSIINGGETSDATYDGPMRISKTFRLECRRLTYFLYDAVHLNRPKGKLIMAPPNSPSDSIMRK